MPLLSLKELSNELSVPAEFIEDLIKKHIITPYGGRARLGEPRFSHNTIPNLREKIAGLIHKSKSPAL